MNRIFTIALIILVNISFGQNLIENGSFEQRYKLKQIDSLMRAQSNLFAPGWRSCNYISGTPDLYYPMRNSGANDIPVNLMGNQKCKFGKNYAGFFLMREYIENRVYQYSREFIQTELKEPLKANCYYEISFYISLAEDSRFCAENIGIYFSDEILLVRDVNDMLKYEAANEFSEQKFLCEKNHWSGVKFIYKAKGDEKFLIIGNFAPIGEAIVKPDEVKGGEKIDNFAYYYIDNIELQPLDRSCHNPDYVFDLSADSLFVFNNILFETDKAELQEISFPVLDQIVASMKYNPKIKIEIGGHTDDVGDEYYNKDLSEDRAKAVANYLIEKGIAEDRIQTKGYGETTPITTNETEEGRHANRRVEIKVLE
jgi:OOP family OmpA-OmpF porin